MAHHLRGHDAWLKGLAVLNNSVAVYAALVREGILAYDGRSYRDLDASEPFYQSPGFYQVFGLYAGAGTVDGMQAHHSFGQVGVACSLAKTIYADLDLASACLHSRQAVGHSEPEVIVAMDIDHHIHIIADVLDKAVEGREELPLPPCPGCL